jgi:hypothetical protein
MSLHWGCKGAGERSGQYALEGAETGTHRYVLYAGAAEVDCVLFVREVTARFNPEFGGAEPRSVKRRENERLRNWIVRLGNADRQRSTLMPMSPTMDSTGESVSLS